MAGISCGPDGADVGTDRSPGAGSGVPPCPSTRLLLHIESRIEETTLTPASAARALGWSVRRVHDVMRRQGTSFMAHVQRRRLERAHQLLGQGRHAIADVAYGCGFNSLATFYRRYGAAFGMTPATTRSRAVAAATDTPGSA